MSRRRSHRGVLFWLIASQLVSVGSLVFWAAIAGLSFMAFDSGPSTAAWLFVGSILSYPFWMILCIGLAWWWYRRGRFRRAAIVTAVPFALVLAVCLLLALPW